jgi:Secretion system C-terminal sorting domain
MEGAASVLIIDGRGKVVEKSSLQLSKGFNQLNLDISDLNSGMYYIIVDGLSAERLSKRFIVVK